MTVEARPLVQQVALVTGGSSGIGAACAVTLAEAGAAVVVNHIGDAEAAEDVVSRIGKMGGRATAIEADISDEQQVARMFGRTVAEFGTVHILLNNAGIQKDAPFLDLSAQDWQRVIDVNLTGHFLCAREAAREFCRRGIQEDVSAAAGKIIFMSSVHQTIPWAGHVNYAASKGGMRMLMETIAQEMAPRGIRVNAVAPGAIRTPINRSVWEDPESLQTLCSLIPYGRMGEPEDVAKAVVWLASDESDYVTGTTLVIDGGMTLYPGFRSGG